MCFFCSFVFSLGSGASSVARRGSFVLFSTVRVRLARRIWTTGKLIEYAKHIFMHEQLHFSHFASSCVLILLQRFFSVATQSPGRGSHRMSVLGRSQRGKNRNKLTAIWARRHFFCWRFFGFGYLIRVIEPPCGLSIAMSRWILSALSIHFHYLLVWESKARVNFRLMAMKRADHQWRESDSTLARKFQHAIASNHRIIITFKRESESSVAAEESNRARQSFVSNSTRSKSTCEGYIHRLLAYEIDQYQWVSLCTLKKIEMLSPVSAGGVSYRLYASINFFTTDRIQHSDWKRKC